MGPFCCLNLHQNFVSIFSIISPKLHNSFQETFMEIIRKLRTHDINIPNILMCEYIHVLLTGLGHFNQVNGLTTIINQCLSASTFQHYLINSQWKTNGASCIKWSWWHNHALQNVWIYNIMDLLEGILLLHIMASFVTKSSIIFSNQDTLS